MSEKDRKNKKYNYISKHFLKKICCRTESITQLSTSREEELFISSENHTEKAKFEKNRPQTLLNNKFYHTLHNNYYNKSHYSERKKGNVTESFDIKYPVAACHEKYQFHKPIDLQVAGKNYDSNKSRGNSSCNEFLLKNFDKIQIDEENMTEKSYQTSKLQKENADNFMKTRNMSTSLGSNYKKSNVETRKKLWQNLYKTLRKLFLLETLKFEELDNDDIKSKTMMLLKKRPNKDVSAENNIDKKDKQLILTKKDTKDEVLDKKKAEEDSDTSSEEESSSEESSEENEKPSEKDIPSKPTGKQEQKLPASEKLEGKIEEKEIEDKSQVEEQEKDEKQVKKLEEIKKPEPSIDKSQYRGADENLKKAQILEIDRSLTIEPDIKKKVTFDEYAKPFHEIIISSKDPPQSYRIGENIITINSERLPTPYKIEPKVLSNLKMELKQSRAGEKDHVTSIDLCQISPNDVLYSGQSINDIVQPESDKNSQVILISPEYSKTVEPVQAKPSITILPSKYGDDEYSKMLKKSIVSQEDKPPILLPLLNKTGVRDTKTRPTVVAVPASEKSKFFSGSEDKGVKIIISPSPSELCQHKISEGVIDKKWSDFVQNLSLSLPSSLKENPMLIVIPEEYDTNEKFVDNQLNTVWPLVFIPSSSSLPQEQIIKDEIAEGFIASDQQPTLIVFPSKSEHTLIKIEENQKKSFPVSLALPDKYESINGTYKDSKIVADKPPAKYQFFSTLSSFDGDLIKLKAVVSKEDQSSQQGQGHQGKYSKLMIHSKYDGSQKNHKQLKNKASKKKSNMMNPYIIVHNPKKSALDEDIRSRKSTVRRSDKQKLSVEKIHIRTKKNEEKNRSKKSLIETDLEKPIQMDIHESGKNIKSNISKLKSRSQSIDKETSVEKRQSKERIKKTYGQLLKEKFDARLEEGSDEEDTMTAAMDPIMVALYEKKDNKH